MTGFKAGLIILAATICVVTGLRCGLCLFSNTHKACRNDDHVCDADQKYCFMQKLENEHGTVNYKGGCATKEMCDYMKFRPPSLSLGKREPWAKHTCEECCNDKDQCNAELCYTPSIADIFHSMYTTESTTTTTTTTTTVPPVPVQCELCSGSLCGLHSMKYSFLCPHGKPFCMNTVVNYANGTKHITKSCATVSDCKQKWWLDSSSRSECQHFAVNDVVPFEFTCNYCCTSDDCNMDIIPKQETVFKGSH